MSYGQEHFACDECKRPFKDGETAVATKEVKCNIHSDGWKELAYHSPRFIEIYCDKCWDAIFIGVKQ